MKPFDNPHSHYVPIVDPLQLSCHKGALHFVDLPYRITSGSLEKAENTAKWIQGDGSVRAWAVFQPVFWTVDTGGDAALLPQILDWVERRAHHLGRPCWFFEALETDIQRLALLADAGYFPQTETPINPYYKVRMVYTGNVPNVRCSTGITIRSLGGSEEVEAL